NEPAESTMGGRPDAVRVLIVAEVDDELTRAVAASISQAGAQVEVAPDVYDAIARLAHDSQHQVRMVLVDLRTADRAERRGFGGIRDYFSEGGAASLPAAPGGRNPAPGAPTAPPGAPGRINTKAIIPIDQGSVSGMPRPAAKPDAGPAELIAAVAPPDEPELKLHDAVRLRMNADAGLAPVRRTPPRTTPQPIDLKDDLLQTTEP